MRLESDVGKMVKLTEAEQICKWNSTMVRKLHKEEEQQVEENSKYGCETNEDELLSLDFPDETLAFDCETKIGNFNVRKQTNSLIRGGEF